MIDWHSETHTIADIRDWDDLNKLELQPDFQRKVVWTKSAQIMLIDTILKNIPIPKIYIKTVLKEGKSYRIVIDGQQRLTAILDFIHDKFKLISPYNGDFYGMKFSDLTPSDQSKILMYNLDMNEIFNPTDEEIRDIYSRVNKYTVQLNKQELRKADFPGDFIRLAEKIAELEFFETSKIFTITQKRRMYDVEFIEELLTIILEGIQDKKDYLDDICEKYINMDNTDTILQIFESILNDILVIFDNKEMPISSTRFKQKSDFYSLFACVYELKKSKTINPKLINPVREELSDMDKFIGPQSEIDEYREYAAYCLSDANSKGSRIWRTDFLGKIINKCYS